MKSWDHMTRNGIITSQKTSMQYRWRRQKKARHIQLCSKLEIAWKLLRIRSIWETWYIFLVIFSKVSLIASSLKLFCEFSSHHFKCILYQESCMITLHNVMFKHDRKKLSNKPHILLKFSIQGTFLELNGSHCVWVHCPTQNPRSHAISNFKLEKKEFREF